MIYKGKHFILCFFFYGNMIRLSDKVWESNEMGETLVESRKLENLICRFPWSRSFRNDKLRFRFVISFWLQSISCTSMNLLYLVFYFIFPFPHPVATDLATKHAYFQHFQWSYHIAVRFYILWNKNETKRNENVDLLFLGAWGFPFLIFVTVSSSSWAINKHMIHIFHSRSKL